MRSDRRNRRRIAEFAGRALGRQNWNAGAKGHSPKPDDALALEGPRRPVHVDRRDAGDRRDRPNVPKRRKATLAGQRRQSAQPFGGRRWWFICPRTGRRVLKLHKPSGALTFASRQAYITGSPTSLSGKPTTTAPCAATSSCGAGLGRTAGSATTFRNRNGCGCGPTTGSSRKFGRPRGSWTATCQPSSESSSNVSDDDGSTGGVAGRRQDIPPSQDLAHVSDERRLLRHSAVERHERQKA